MGKARYFPICCIWAWVLNTPNASRCGNLRIVWFCIENKRWTSVASSISFSLEHREFNSTFSVSSLTSDMPSHDSFALLPSNRSYSTDVWYDKVAIISTRGYTNIYHNAEWIANFYHIVTNIEKFPLVWMNLLFELVLCIFFVNPAFVEGDSRSNWVLSYINETLSMFPDDIRPFYVPYSSFFAKHNHIWIRRAVLDTFRVWFRCSSLLTRPFLICSYRMLNRFSQRK